MRRLALFFDGTWNSPKSETNVFTLRNLVAPVDDAGINQVSEYFHGVGTKWNDHVRGGVVGKGLEGNVLQGYTWLADNYQEGDEIFLFGFSRGAYTARSVAGMIIKCGLLRNGAEMTPAEVFSRYEDGKAQRPIHTLQHVRTLTPEALVEDGMTALDAEEQRLLANSRRVPIHCVAVWDTVGARGIPWTAAPFIGRGKYFFHNPNLSVLIRHAYHALAVDEHRSPYKPTLWTRFTPDKPDPTLPPSPEQHPPQAVEQRWFCGAHANVGGGYGAKDLLPHRPLAWLQMKADGAGLKFTSTLHPHPGELDCAPRDSFAEFLWGVYRIVRINQRYYRSIGAGRRAVKGGWSTPINEWIDESVFERYRADPMYRPKNLVKWANARGIDLSKQAGSIPA